MAGMRGDVHAGPDTVAHREAVRGAVPRTRPGAAQGAAHPLDQVRVLAGCR